MKILEALSFYTEQKITEDKIHTIYLILESMYYVFCVFNQTDEYFVA